ncbi:MAG: hypothetical protein ACXWCW_29990, partial [Burkholderiales bacterium]
SRTPLWSFGSSRCSSSWKGIVAKDVSATYTAGRSKRLQKIKTRGPGEALTRCRDSHGARGCFA